MTAKPLHSSLRTVLEYGPIIGFVATYLIVRNDTFLFAGTDYTGFVAVTAAFIPIFVIAISVQWLLSGKIARLQVATVVMFVLFGGLGVWLNDPSLLKMKPTAIYLTLALILMVGLWRGQSWLKYIVDDLFPMKHKGWMILTRRLTWVFVASAAANELVWRTQSETFWLFFETIAMPIAIIVFFISQIGLFVTYATLKPAKGKAR